MSEKQSNKKEGELSGKEYTKELRRLQAELCKLQAWVKHKGLRVIVVFEGRDAAGKGVTIRAQLHHTFSEPDSLWEGSAGKGEVAAAE